jgi:serine/threonine protein kinase
MLAFLNEQIAIESFNSPYVIRKFETIKTQRHYYSVMEYCNGLTLSDLLDYRVKLTERETWNIFR